ncbi:MAG TPA: helix-hairpin-helix domain-containing protein [Burkholderiaceae bacterium]|nr:helix-hairpin-helix domain-containing protein [Burkholderiaceae bacterium]
MKTASSSPPSDRAAGPAVDSAENRRVADMLREAAALLGAQRANPFRASAYRRAADAVAGLTTSVRMLLERAGRAGLEALPAIGPGIASAIVEIISTGRWRQLDRLRGEVDPRQLFQAVPGIGAELSERIHDELGIDTLEALEVAAHDGRLEEVQGVGPRRASAIRVAVARVLRRARGLPTDADSTGADRLPVEALLDVDREYRSKAQAGVLPLIAPRRFNPGGEAWLPILHTRRGPWHFTALYSNTATAHELGRTHDWVVVYFHRDDLVEHQHTIVTETRGPLGGLRVVRGREAQCREYYQPAATS